MNLLEWIGNTDNQVLIIFIITYTGIIFTRLPWINIDRPSAAFFGAVAVLICGGMSMEDAIMAIDFNTIFLLLGMMIIIATLQIDGFFSYIAAKSISYSVNQKKLLVFITFISGIGSAFLVNDAVVLIFTPVIIVICSNSKLNPVPFIMAEILASNIGSVMTITGNPQNMLIGINSGISYAKFLLYLSPVAIIGLLIIIPVIRLIYKSDFNQDIRISSVSDSIQYNFSSMKVSVPVFILVIVMFFIGKIINLSIPLIALSGASLILIFGKIKPSEVIRKVDWVLLLFFACLFIVVAAIQKTSYGENWINSAQIYDGFNTVVSIHSLSLIMSQIVSNVPFTIVMLPVINTNPHDILWLSLASASTLAGNATIIGAMANLIAVESASKNGIRISFWEFIKSGLITTLISFIISLGVLFLCFNL